MNGIEIETFSPVGKHGIKKEFSFKGNLNEDRDIWIILNQSLQRLTSKWFLFCCHGAQRLPVLFPLVVVDCDGAAVRDTPPTKEPFWTRNSSRLLSPFSQRNWWSLPGTSAVSGVILQEIPMFAICLQIGMGPHGHGHLRPGNMLIWFALPVQLAPNHVWQQAIPVWPGHPTIWMLRLYWSLVYPKQARFVNQAWTNMARTGRRCVGGCGGYIEAVMKKCDKVIYGDIVNRNLLVDRLQYERAGWAPLSIISSSWVTGTSGQSEGRTPSNVSHVS